MIDVPLPQLGNRAAPVRRSTGKVALTHLATSTSETGYVRVGVGI